MGFRIFQDRKAEILLVYALLCIGVFVARKMVSRYLLLPAGILSLGMTFFQIFKHSAKAVTGPVGITKMVAGVYDIRSAVSIAVVISMGLAIFNMIPILPLDGGKIFFLLVRRFGRRVSRLYEYSGLAMFGFLIVLALYSDFAK